MMMLIAPFADMVQRDASGVLHVVALSGGKDSTAMALRLRELHPDTPFTYACTPTGDELPEVIEHWKALGDRLGSRIWPISSGYSLKSLIKTYKALPNWRQRWCTRQIKIEPYGEWLAKMVQNGPVVSYVGLRSDEEAREGGDYAAIPDVEMRFPMREWGWTLYDVRLYLTMQEQTIPRRTDCARCYHQTLHEWFLLWRDYPAEWADAVADEADTGHTFRSPSRDTWPASLAEMQKRFEAGEIPKQRQRRTSCRVCSL